MKTFFLLIFSLLLCVPVVFAVNVGGGITPIIETEDFDPLIWLCGSRVVYDDATEPGRITLDGQELTERQQNYAFEGEQIHWDVLVMDKNGIQKISDVFVSIGPHRDARRLVSFTFNDTACMNDCSITHSSCVATCNQLFDPQLNATENQACVSQCDTDLVACQSTCERTGQRLEQNDIEVNCVENRAFSDDVADGCNARILEEDLTGRPIDSSIQRYYSCTFTVETPLSMYGEYWVTVEVEDLDGGYNHIDEVEYWFLNPVIALGIDGSVQFSNVRPGTQVYSTSLLISNEADDGSGVMMDMFISGTDFYDSSSSGAACPTSNVLNLANMRYWAANGYSTNTDPRADAEGYVPIAYGIGFNDPNPFYGTHEIIQGAPLGAYFAGNILSPGADIAITFRLSVPEPCNGDFDSGGIFFWGEAI